MAKLLCWQGRIQVCVCCGWGGGDFFNFAPPLPKNITLKNENLGLCSCFFYFFPLIITFFSFKFYLQLDNLISSYFMSKKRKSVYCKPFSQHKHLCYIYFHRINIYHKAGKKRWKKIPGLPKLAIRHRIVWYKHTTKHLWLWESMLYEKMFF